MIRLDKINDAAFQIYTLIADNGNQIQLRLTYMPSQQIWVCGFTWNDVVYDGFRLVNSPNLIRNVRNIVPFGFLITSTDGIDPYLYNDFTSGRCEMYLINADEVSQVEAAYFGEV